MATPTKKLREKIDDDLANQDLEDFNHSDARFSAVFDTAAIGIGIMDLGYRIIDANPALCQMLGLQCEDLIGQTPMIVTHPENHQVFSQEMGELAGGLINTFRAEWRLMRKEGEVFWAHVTLSVVRGPEGKPRYLIAMFVDIDEQKKASAKLQESELRFRTMFENASVGIALVGLDGHPLAVNPVILRMTGYSEDELLKMNGLQLSHPDDRAMATEPMRDLIEGKQEVFQVECRFIRKNGEVYWVRQRISAIFGADRKPLNIVVMVADIDEQKRTQIELEESERRFRAIFENVSIGMAMVSLDQRIIAVNQTTEKIIGYTAKELVGSDPIDLSYSEDRMIGTAGFQELVAGQRNSLSVEKRYVRKNGEVFWARITYLLVRGSDGQPQLLVGSIEDINERKMAIEELTAREREYLRILEQNVEERTRELRESNLRLVAEIEQRQKVEEAFASKAAEEAILAERTRLARDLHDAVTQTLFSASLIAEVLPELWDISETEARKSTEELRQLTRGALAEMRTLLLELRPSALTQARFPDLLKQLSEAVIGRARLPVEVSVEGNYDLPPDIKVAFYRIAQESLNNVVKYARASQVWIKVRQECCKVHLSITDNGVGFDPSGVKPTSLGMRIMRERAEGIHAHFKIESAPDQGTTVSVDWNEDELISFQDIQIRGNP